MGKSAFVCRRCGQPVIGWRNGWKHASGGGAAPTCGRLPVPVERCVYEREINDILGAVLERLPWRSGE